MHDEWEADPDGLPNAHTHSLNPEHAFQDTLIGSKKMLVKNARGPTRIANPLTSLYVVRLNEKVRRGHLRPRRNR